MNTVKARCFGILVMSAAVASCSGGSGESNEENETLIGVFSDSPVAGINFSTASNSGVTGSGGEFTYRDGETVVFSIGNLTLPPTVASELVTPLDMGIEPDINDPSVVNIARLLQSLDDDGNPENGILITEQITSVFTDQVAFDTTDDAAVAEVVSQVYGSDREAVPADQAVSHFLDTLIANADSNGTLGQLNYLVAAGQTFNGESLFVDEPDFSFNVGNQVYTGTASVNSGVYQLAAETTTWFVTVQDTAEGKLACINNAPVSVARCEVGLYHLFEEEAQAMDFNTNPNNSPAAIEEPDAGAATEAVESETEESFPACESTALDSDGDGYGWQDNSTCLIVVATEAVAETNTDNVQPSTDMEPVVDQESQPDRSEEAPQSETSETTAAPATELPTAPEVPSQPVSPTDAEAPSQPLAPPDAEAPSLPIAPPDAEAPTRPVATPDVEAPALPVAPPDAEAPSLPVAPPAAGAPSLPVSPPDAEPPSLPVSPPDAEAPSLPVATPDVEAPSLPVATPDVEAPSLPVAPPDAEAPSPPVATPDAEAPSLPVSPPDAEAPSLPVSPPDAEAPSLPVSPPDAEAPPLPASPPDAEAPSLPVSPPDAETPSLPVAPPDAEAPSLPLAPPDAEAPSLPVSPPDAEAPSLPVSPPDAEVPSQPVASPDVEAPSLPLAPPDVETPSLPVAPPDTEAPSQPVASPDAEAPSLPIPPPDTETPSPPVDQPETDASTDSAVPPVVEVPSTPDVEIPPEIPSPTDIPTQPVLPEAPAMPEVPTVPEAPTEPETPTAPEAPTESETPIESEAPVEPEAPTEPELIPVPETPIVTQPPSTPAEADLPPVSEAGVQPSDITDIIVLTGQGNAAGVETRYDPALDTGNENLFAFNEDGQWRAANLNQFWDGNLPSNYASADNGRQPYNNLVFQIGKSLTTQTDRVVGVILVTAPGAGIRNWDYNSTFYREIRSKVALALDALPQKATIDAMIWVQGETDWLAEGTADPDATGFTSTDTDFYRNYYPTKLGYLIANLRSEWWYGREAQFICSETKQTDLNHHLLALNADGDDRTSCAPASDLATRDSDPFGNHFSADSLRTLGSRIAELYLSHTE